MLVKEGIRELLTADAGVAALVGTRVYSKVARYDAATRPFVLVELENAQQAQHMLGPADLVRHLVSLVIFDDEDERAWAVADACRTALDGFAGVAGSTQIDRIYFDDEEDDQVWETDAGELPAYLARQRYACWTRR